MQIGMEGPALINADFNEILDIKAQNHGIQQLLETPVNFHFVCYPINLLSCYYTLNDIILF